MKPKQTEDSTHAFLKEIGRFPLLTPDEEITLGRRIQAKEYYLSLKKEHGCVTDDDLALVLSEEPAQIKRTIASGWKAQTKMVNSNLRLVVSVAKKYSDRGIDMLDLIQEGAAGLMRGAEKFDPSRGYKFSTYTYWWIRQGITRAIAEKSRSIRVPAHVLELQSKDNKAQRSLAQQLGRTPTSKEVADELGISKEQLLDMRHRTARPTSLESKVGENRDSSLIDMLEDDFPPLLDVVADEMEYAQLHEKIQRLPDQQCEVIRMHFGIGDDCTEPMSLTAIGKVMNMSRDRARTLRTKGLERLRYELSKNS